MTAQIKISNSTPGGAAVIDIEGTIGMPEEWQFEDPEQRVATYERFRQSVRQIADLNATEVVVNIRSTGGDVGDALLIYEALRSLRATVTTRCYGYAASAATIIAQAASEGRRELASSSLYLIHKSIVACEGNAAELQRKTQLLDQTDRRIAQIYAQRAGMPEEHFLQIMDENDGQGRWLSPQQAVECGLADRILQAGDDLPQDHGRLQNAMQRIKSRVNALLHSPRAEGQQFRLQYEQLQQELHRRRLLQQARAAQDAALPTRTKEKEDPSLEENSRGGNRTAYAIDAKNFREQAL